ncbi:MAG: S8 family serine peptidase [Thermoleophilia bacterium]
MPTRENRPRPHRILAAAALCLAAAAAPATAVAGADTTPAPAEASVPVIVLLRAQVDPAADVASPRDRIRSLRRTAARTQDPVAALTRAGDRRFWLVNAIATRATPTEIQRLNGHSQVERVAIDPPIRTQATPASAASASTGSFWGLPRIGAPRAWGGRGQTGTGTVIGSIDTGVDAAHPALAGRIVGWRDFVNGAPTPYDDNGHGTHTIGTMVGQAPGATPIGVAPGARVVVAKAIGADGQGRGSAILAAAQWLTDPDGNPATADHPQVINNSWSSPSGDPWFRPMVQQWVSLGIVPVFAAGNTGPGPTTISSPADYPESLAVGATDPADRIAAFSARGPVIWGDPDGTGPTAGTRLAKPDITAPGVGITSTVPGGRYQQKSGTSMAAPHAAGVAALLTGARPGITPAEVIDILRRTATDRGPTGHDDDYGAGILNADAALAAAGIPSQPGTPQPTDTPTTGPGVGRTAPPAPSRADRGRVRLTLTQMRTTRRIAVQALRRVTAIEARLTRRAAPHDLTTRPVRALTRRELTITRRIARAAITRAARIERRRGAPVRTVTIPRQRNTGRLTLDDMRLTDALARTALTRARALRI